MATTGTTKRKFTAETAVQFDSYSLTNASILQEVCPACAPYVDWFTYNRWQALGQQVQRGQKGTKLTVYIEEQDPDDEKKSHLRRWTSTVFCRHQVAPQERKN